MQDPVFQTSPIKAEYHGDDLEIIEEKNNSDYEPTEEEVIEYAKWLGVDPETETDLLCIAYEGLKAPLPENWRVCKTSKGEIYYLNLENSEITQDHPCDTIFKNKIQDIKRARDSITQLRAEQLRQNTINNVQQLTLSTKEDLRTDGSRDNLPTDRRLDSEPTEEEVLEYAKFLGIDPHNDKEHLKLVRESLKEKLPENWKIEQKPDGEIYYYNLETRESVTEHPLDTEFKKKYAEFKYKSRQNQSLDKGEKGRDSCICHCF